LRVDADELILVSSIFKRIFSISKNHIDGHIEHIYKKKLGENLKLKENSNKLNFYEKKLKNDRYQGGSLPR